LVGHCLDKLAQGSPAVTAGQQARNIHVHIPGKWNPLGGIKVLTIDSPTAVPNCQLMLQAMVFIKQETLLQQLPVVSDGLK
jgi:hypothetical protein